MKINTVYQNLWNKEKPIQGQFVAPNVNNKTKQEQRQQRTKITTS